MKLRLKMMLASIQLLLLLGTVGYAEQSAMITDTGTEDKDGVPWDFTGTWYVTYAEYNGVPQDPAMLGENMIFLFHGDGTAEGITPDLHESYTWELRDTYMGLYSGYSLMGTFYAVDGHLVCLSGSLVMVLGRSPRAEAYASPVRTDATLQDFIGTWADVFAIKGDVRLPQELIPLCYGLIIDEDTMNLYCADAEVNLFWSPPVTTWKPTLKNGLLYANEDTYAALHEDGSLSLHMWSDVFYLSPPSPEGSDTAQQTGTRLTPRRRTLAAGWNHTAVLKDDGTVMAVGSNKQGQCSVGDWTDIVSICAGFYHTVGLKADGTVVYAGDNWIDESEISEWTDIVDICANSRGTVGLKADGTVVRAGTVHEYEIKMRDWRNIVAISAGGEHVVGLKADGTVAVVSEDEDGGGEISAWKDIVAISSGTSHTVGLKADGTVVAVGWTAHGKCDVDDWTDIVAVSAGCFQTVGLKADGTVVAVGLDDACDVGDWTDIVAISAGEHHTVGLKADGTIVAVGYNEYGQCDIQP